MKQRTLTGLAMVALLILLFFTKGVTPYVFDAFIVILAMYAGYEMSELLKKMGYYNNKWCIILYPLVSYGLYKLCISKKVELYFLIVMQIALIILISAGISIYYALAKKTTENEIKTRKLKYSNEQFALYKGIQTLFGLIYPGFIIMLLFVVNNVEGMKYVFTKFSDNAYNISLFLLIYTFTIPVIVDTFAMLTGSLFKGKKLCERISPNKTVSGAIGGFIFGTLAAIALFFIFNSIDTYRLLFISLNLTWWKVMIVGIISSIVCQIGDLFESFLKRKANVKDSGDLLPGHGGVLDRFDSHIANILVVFIFLLVL